MPRRRRGGVSEAGLDGGGLPTSDNRIEILDPETLFDDRPAEVVESESNDSNSSFAILAGLIIGGVALFGVVTAGNTPAPEPPAPSVTVPPDPIDEAEAIRAAEIAELEATYGVEIGDGPELRWQRVVWNIDATDVRWVDDGFVGYNAETEWTIRPSLVGPTVSQRENLAVEYPGYQLQPVQGARLLLPISDTPDHLLVAVGETDPVRFELPLVNPPEPGLVRTAQTWADGLALDDRLLLTGFFSFDESDIDEALGDGFSEVSRLGVPAALMFDLVGGSVEEIPLDGLQAPGSINRTNNGAAISWADRAGQSWISSTSDGSVWSTTPSSAEGNLWFVGPRLYSIPTGELRSIRRSNDVGRTWQRTRRPFVASSAGLAVDDVLIVSENQPELMPLQPASINTDDVSINTDDYVVTITGAGRSFELTDPTTGELVLSGAINDSATGVAFDPFENGLSIADPESGDELLSIPQGALLQAYAEASNLDAPEIAFARWATDADDPEWFIQPIDALFNDAVRVDFEVGVDHVLAIVTTTRGVDYYLTSTE